MVSLPRRCIVESLKINSSIGLPVALGTIIMREHQFVAVLRGTGSIIPRATSLSRSLLTFSAPWSGTGTGVCTAVAFTSGSATLGIGSPCICGSGCLRVGSLLNETKWHLVSFSLVLN